MITPIVILGRVHGKVLTVSGQYVYGSSVARSVQKRPRADILRYSPSTVPSDLLHDFVLEIAVEIKP